jgi:IclR family transcriptional regulator, acetate operon repressor
MYEASLVCAHLSKRSQVHYHRPHNADTSRMKITDTNSPLRRVQELMDVVSGSSGGITLKQIASELNLPASTCYRMVQALIDSGYLSATGRPALYSAGDRFLRQAHSSLSSGLISKLATPIVREAAAQLAETVFMTRLVGTRLHQVCEELSRAGATARILPGANFPVHASSSGKAVCAFQGHTLQGAMLRDCDFHPYQPHTIVTTAQMKKEIERVRLQGYAECDNELDSHVYAISFPVKLPIGVLYSIGLVCHEHRKPTGRRLEECGEILRFACSQVASFFGDG